MLPIRLDGDDIIQKRHEIRDYFHNTCHLYELLFTMFEDDSVFYQQSELTRHPMIFYFGHTATFFINKLILGGIITERLNPNFESMFAVGVDEMHWDDLNAEHYRWPDVAEVRAYRHQVRTLVDELIMTLPLTLPLTQEDPMWIILMGIEHERIHIETSSVLHRQLDITAVHPIDALRISPHRGDAPQNVMIALSGARVRLGKEKSHPLYGWDNEYGEEHIEVAPFEVSKYLVSNAEFMAFVEDGGYENSAYWDEEGERFLRVSGATHPSFWVPQDDGSFKYRALCEEIAMPMNWPVDVNALEAMAFCRWKSQHDGISYTLPSEAQWYRMYALSSLQECPDFNESRANINLAHYASATAVDEFAHGELYDVVGNVWQWTRTPIDAFSGFAVHPIYDDFSTPTFDGRHNLMKGGSFISNGNEIMYHSRYAFRRHFYQHAGFRYVQDEMPEFESDNIYESDALVSQYCDFHYGETYFDVANFAKKCAELAAHYAQDTAMRKAL
ncbi:MAG: 5-histidylcysteine sulfoxide synthase, partial [Sulfurimonas sp.]